MNRHRFNVEEHTTLDGKTIDVFPKCHMYIHELEQRVKEQKEVIDGINHILNNQINYREFVDMINDIEDVVKKVSE